MKKYRFKDRKTAEAELARAELTLTLHRITLDCLLREEYTFTERFTADNGAWFQMGIARANGPHGGVVLLRESYPSNPGPSQDAHWAESWLAEVGSALARNPPLDSESTKFRECFYAVRELHNQLSKAA